ncbi:vacuolar protein sorting-associated protein 35, partial [Rozella allomycis CSF55]
ADANGFESEAYEFISQSFLIYEEYVSDSKSQLKCFTSILTHLSKVKYFSSENYDILSSRCLLYASRMLKKSDQCRALASTAYIFQKSDNKKLLDCLQRSLKAADSVMDSSESSLLFIEILNHYIYFNEKLPLVVTEKHIHNLTELIQTNLKDSSND